MPHYSDGVEAKVGDKVIGTPYNHGKEICGEVIQVTPNSDSCNLIVAFVECIKVSGMINTAIGAVATVSNNRIQQRVLLIGAYDYGDTKSFRKVQ